MLPPSHKLVEPTAGGSHWLWEERNYTVRPKQCVLSPIWERQWIGIGIHVLARCSIHCNAFQGMLIKLSEGMCIGMVVYLRLALAG